MKPSRSLGLFKLALVCGATSALAFITLAATAVAAAAAAETSLAVSGSQAAATKPSSGLLPTNGAELFSSKRKQTDGAESFGEPRGLESNIANAKVQVSPIDMAAAAGHHHGKSHGGHGKYYMYTEVPKKHSYKMGFKRGNHKHTIERKESVHKSHVHSYFKWHDKKGKGSHKFEYKHEDHKKKHHH